MIRVGYLEGTDPLFLTELAARGIDTMPLSNGIDHHGRRIDHLSAADQVSAVVGYLYKVIPLAGSNRTPLDLLHACQVNEIPILIIAPTAVHGRAAESLGEARRFVTLVDPGDLRSAFEKVAG
jgi:hypothetical protein